MSDTIRYEFYLHERDSDSLSGFPEEKNMSAEVIFRSDVQWHSVLYEFAKFLGSHYGYDLTDKIKVDGEKLGDVVLNNTFAAEKLKKEFSFPAMKPKKKKKNKEIESFFMGSQADWEGEE